MNKINYYRYEAVITIILTLHTFLCSLHDALGNGFIYLIFFLMWTIFEEFIEFFTASNVRS